MKPKEHDADKIKRLKEEKQRNIIQKMRLEFLNREKKELEEALANKKAFDSLGGSFLAGPKKSKNEIEDLIKSMLSNINETIFSLEFEDLMDLKEEEIEILGPSNFGEKTRKKLEKDFFIKLENFLAEIEIKEMAAQERGFDDFVSTNAKDSLQKFGDKVTKL